MKTKAFKVHITETFSRDVIIRADDECEATEIAENLCNLSTINITSSDDFGDRNIEVVGLPDNEEKKKLHWY